MLKKVIILGGSGLLGKNLIQTCKDRKIEFLSTPFDHDAVKFLNKLVPFFKIASADATNIPLIEKVCRTGKPILLSTGACNEKEIKLIENFVKKNFPKIDLALMHCILSYPTKYKDANLNIIKVLKKKYPHRVIGYSDHTMPDKNSIVISHAYNLGAQIIEKHFTLDRLKGKKNNDHFHSMDFNDLKTFWRNINVKKLYSERSFLSTITGNKKERKVLLCEKSSRKNARRSIFTNGKISKGNKFSDKNIILKRPGDGISPLLIKKVLHKRSNKILKDDHKLEWSDIVV